MIKFSKIARVMGHIYIVPDLTYALIKKINRKNKRLFEKFKWNAKNLMRNRIFFFLIFIIIIFVLSF